MHCIQRLLSYSIKFLLRCLKTEKIRQAAYISLGLLLKALSRAQFRNVDGIMNAIFVGFTIPFCNEVSPLYQSNLSNQHLMSSPYSTQALQCLEMVLNFNVASRSLLTQDALDTMFSGGLSEELIRCLQVCVHTLPNLRDHIQKKLRCFIYDKLQEYALQRVMVNNAETKKVLDRNYSIFSLKNWFNAGTSFASRGSLDLQQTSEMEVILALKALTQDVFFPSFYPVDHLTRFYQ